MHIIHNTIWAPKIIEENIWINESKFTVLPLPRWYWVTVWNSLRRIILSSIPWARVTWLKVKWVHHEYDTIPWVKDTVLDIILTLKELVIDTDDLGVQWLQISKNTAWPVLASDIKLPAWVKVINPDLEITSIDSDWLELDMEIKIEKGVGYKDKHSLLKEEDDVNVLPIDVNFSPVISVSYNILPHRSGNITNLDSLEITVKTNWVLSPIEVMQFGSNMLISYISLFTEDWLLVEWEFISDVKQLIEKEKQETEEEMEKEEFTHVELLWLSPRTYNAVYNGWIYSIEQLAKCTEAKLTSIKWFGRKAMTEVRDTLAQRWLKLLWDD